MTDPHAESVCPHAERRKVYDMYADVYLWRCEADRHELARCRHCGRKLEDPLSVERGIGSQCWQRGHR